jgi:putative SOS response-associated peptidase YedK
MCSHYQGIKAQERFQRFFGVSAPAHEGKIDLWPGYLGSFIRRHPHADAGDEAVPPTEALNGLFGLVPHWAKDLKIARNTYNARSETVAEKPSFRDAWRRAQHCIIPAEAFFEPDWRSGKAVATCIQRADGQPMGIAGLWTSWRSPTGETLHSYTMLTISAEAHALMQQFHKPADEKRMVVILQPDQYAAWLSATAANSPDFLQAYPAEQLQASSVTPQKTLL